MIERGADLVLAAHHTPLASRLTVTTVETVRFERPRRVTFRLVKGPVPHVAERYELRPSATGTASVRPARATSAAAAASRDPATAARSASVMVSFYMAGILRAWRRCPQRLGRSVRIAAPASMRS
jgi:hypothetical protein